MISQTGQPNEGSSRSDTQLTITVVAREVFQHSRNLWLEARRGNGEWVLQAPVQIR